MSIGLLGRKIGMTQIFQEDGTVIPVTVLEVGPCVVVEVKNNDEHGYSAVQLGFIEKKKQVTKPVEGHYKKKNLKPFYFIKEFKVNKEDCNYKQGDVLTVDLFKDSKFVDISGKTKGRGFQGVIKRWGFHGGRATHGSSFHRAPGSIGQCADPSKVFKGVKLPGRYGNEKITIQNLSVVNIKTDRNLILVQGAVPGSNNSIIQIRESIKKKVKN